MKRSAVDVILNQRQRVDASARMAGRFMEDSTKTAMEKLSARLGRLAAKAATLRDHQGQSADRLPAYLERLLQMVGLLRFDEVESVDRVGWIVAEMEEMLNVECMALAAG